MKKVILNPVLINRYQVDLQEKKFLLLIPDISDLQKLIF